MLRHFVHDLVGDHLFVRWKKHPAADEFERCQFLLP
jgi:hypothetical protein